MFLRNPAPAVSSFIVREIYIEKEIGNIIKGIRHIAPYAALHLIVQPKLEILRHISEHVESSVCVLQRKIARHTVEFLLHLTASPFGIRSQNASQHKKLKYLSQRNIALISRVCSIPFNKAINLKTVI